MIAKKKKYLYKLAYENQEKQRQETQRKKIKKAEQKGKDERNFEIAKKMKFKKRPIDEIIEFTSLTNDQINNL